jgi:hypothetical protein
MSKITIDQLNKLTMTEEQRREKIVSLAYDFMAQAVPLLSVPNESAIKRYERVGFFALAIEEAFVECELDDPDGSMGEAERVAFVGWFYKYFRSGIMESYEEIA